MEWLRSEGFQTILIEECSCAAKKRREGRSCVISRKGLRMMSIFLVSSMSRQTIFTIILCYFENVIMGSDSW